MTLINLIKFKYLPTKSVAKKVSLFSRNYTRESDVYQKCYLVILLDRRFELKNSTIKITLQKK